MSLAFHMDVHVPSAVTLGLRRRGLDILTSQEDETRTLDDGALLARATELGASVALSRRRLAEDRSRATRIRSPVLWRDLRWPTGSQHRPACRRFAVAGDMLHGGRIGEQGHVPSPEMTPHKHGFGSDH